MPSVRQSLFVLAVFLCGVALGGGAVAWGYREFILEPVSVSVPATNLAVSLLVLESLRNGEAARAHTFLEDQMDGAIISLAATPDGALSAQTRSTLERAARYRVSNPYTSSAPDVGQSVEHYLSRHRALPAQ